MFKKKEVSSTPDARPSGVQHQILAQVTTDEAAAAKDEPLPQGDNQWAAPPQTGRAKVTRQQAQAIMRGRIGNRHPTLTERIEFQAEYEVIADEPLPIPESPTHHAEILAERAAHAAVVVPPNPIRARIVAAAKVLLGVQESVNKAPDGRASGALSDTSKKHATFFT